MSELFLRDTIVSSVTQGFQNYGTPVPISLVMAPGTLAGNGTRYTASVSVSLDNVAIAMTRVQMNFFDSLWYQAMTYFAQSTPDSGVGEQYRAEVIGYCIGNNFTLKANVINYTASAHTFSSFTINAVVTQYQSPLQASF